MCRFRATCDESHATLHVVDPCDPTRMLVVSLTRLELEALAEAVRHREQAALAARPRFNETFSD